jgi:hypothetical protein
MWMREVYWRGNGHLKGKIADFKLGIKMGKGLQGGAKSRDEFSRH